MATAEAVINLFLTDDAGQARALASQLHDLNAERQQTESEIVAAVLEECERVPVTDDDRALVFCGHDWHRGVLGIVASRLVERFCRPVFVLSQDAGSDEAQGSGRSVASFHLLDALDSMRELFRRYGGHRAAAGLAIDAVRVPEFRRRFNQYALPLLLPENFCPTIEIDAPIDLREISEASVYQILDLAPFGAGNPPPQFLACSLEMAGEPMVIKDRHLRVCFARNGRKVIAKAWNFAERLDEFTPRAKLDAVLSFEEDPYSAARGYPGWALVLRDIRPSEV
jgi:single-stranded-DNA-specific exonuclease